MHKQLYVGIVEVNCVGKNNAPESKQVELFVDVVKSKKNENG